LNKKKRSSGANLCQDRPLDKSDESSELTQDNQSQDIKGFVQFGMAASKDMQSSTATQTKLDEHAPNVMIRQLTIPSTKIVLS
jgi:hypothetical protein